MARERFSIKSQEQFSAALEGLTNKAEGAYEKKQRSFTGGKEVVALLETIPGVQLLSEVRETMEKGDFLSTQLGHTRGLLYGEVDGPHLSVFIDWSATVPDWISVVLSRESGGHTLDVTLVFMDDGKLRLGNMRAYKREVTRYGPEPYNAYKGGLAFDAYGVISNVSEEMQLEVRDIEAINIPELLCFVTDPEGLGQPIEVGRVLSEVVFPNKAT